jgi:hypothetical protein
VFFAFLFGLYHLVGIVNCDFMGGFSGDGSLGCMLLVGPLYYLAERHGWGTPDLIRASAGKVWLLVLLGTLMYGLVGLILGFIGRFALRLLRRDSQRYR